MKSKLRYRIGASALLAIIAFSSNAYADPVLTLNSPGVVGDWSYLSSNASETTRQAAAQTILNMSVNQTLVVGGYTYQTSNLDKSGTLDYGLLITDNGFGSSYNYSGYDYAFVKYDGPNAGYVLFYLGGALASTIVPVYSNTLWMNPNGSGYAVSGTSYFNKITSVPDGGMTLVFLGLGLSLSSWIALRREKKVGLVSTQEGR